MTTAESRQRILEARRAALRARLIGRGLLPSHADDLMTAWTERSGAPLTPAEFDDAFDWIVGQTAGRNRR
jgi:hypothetical protein